MVINYSRKKTDGNEIKQLTELENETFDLLNLIVVETREQEVVNIIKNCFSSFSDSFYSST